MKKVVINNCFGGFNISPLATKMIAKKKGKECYFFCDTFTDGKRETKKVTLEEASKSIFWSAYSVPNPEDYNLDKRDEDGTYKGANKRAEKISISQRGLERHDPDLISVLEEIGSKAASGSCAKLKIIEIPDDVEYQIEEYDGLEHIAEKHKTWN